MSSRSWGWFVRRLSGLLTDDTTLICRVYQQPTQEEAPGV